MIKVLGKDGLIHEYIGEQCGYVEKLKEYDGLFKVISVGEGLGSWLIPIADISEGEDIKVGDNEIDLTHKTVYAYRCEEFYHGDFQNIIDTWCIVGESELSIEKLYEQAKNFKNVYMDIFAEDAFENRRQYITNFYLAGREDLEREYSYLNETQTEDFVEKTVDIIMNQIQNLHT